MLTSISEVTWPLKILSASQIRTIVIKKEAYLLYNFRIFFFFFFSHKITEILSKIIQVYNVESPLSQNFVNKNLQFEKRVTAVKVVNFIPLQNEDKTGK